MTPHETKSPIRWKPLRQPGQSLSEELDRLLRENYASFAFVVAFAVVFIVQEWIRWCFDVGPQPLTVTFISLVMVAFAGWRVVPVLKKVRDVQRGLDGEKAVGECLEDLRADDYQVFHDIPGDGFNVDHVLVGPGGVYAIETKTRWKPARGESQVVYDGQKVTVNGFEPERDPVVQVKASARHIKDVVRQVAGRDLFVQPVLIFPGWYTRQPKKPDVWVLNETALPKWLANERQTLDAEAIQNISAGIAMYVRNSG